MDGQPNIQPQTPASAPETPQANNFDYGKLCAVLAYLFLGIIWYFLGAIPKLLPSVKHNEFAKFHVKQALVLIVASVILSVIGNIFPYWGWTIILPLTSLATTVLTIWGIVNAWSGQKKELPVIGKYASKFTF